MTHFPEPASEDENLFKLAADLESPEDAADLLPVVNRLSAWVAPKPTETEKARLLAALQGQQSWQNISPPDALPVKSPRAVALEGVLNLLYAQRYVVRQEIWAASAVVQALGALVSLALPAAGDAYLPGAQPGFFVVLLAPVAAALSMASIYSPADDPARELEAATPVALRKVLLARMALVFAFNLVGALAASGLVWAAGVFGLVQMGSLGVLLAAWLGPMTLLSTLALLFTTLADDAQVGTLASLALWGYQALHFFQAPGAPAFMQRLPNLLDPALQPWLFLAAILLGTWALWEAGREKHLAVNLS